MRKILFVFLALNCALASVVSCAKKSPTGPAAQDIPDPRQWYQLAGTARWTPRMSHASTVFGAQLWTLGGAQTNITPGPTYNDVWHSADGNDWTQATASAQWSPRYGHAAVAFAGKLWLLGGHTADHDTNDVWNSTDGADWQQVTPAAAWPGRSNFVALVFRDSLWVIGGNRLTGTVYGDVWRSGDGINWQQVTAAMPWAARCYHAGLVHADRMWILGGGANAKASIALDDVWSSADGSAWRQVAPHAPWGVRWGHSAVSYDGKIWLAAGDDSIHCGLDSITRQHDLWCSSDGAQWQLADTAAPWTGRWGQSAAVMGQSLYIMGGYSGAVNDEVWVWR
ncbi:hypothetical protein EG831_00900 [bacterium]|nr:hypothetical protein [bacterium]